MNKVLYTLLFKALRAILAGACGSLVTLGILTQGQAATIIGSLSGILWLASAFVSSVLHHLKEEIALKADPKEGFTFADVKAAAWSAFFDLLKMKGKSNEPNQ